MTVPFTPDMTDEEFARYMRAQRGEPPVVESEPEPTKPSADIEVREAMESILTDSAADLDATGSMFGYFRPDDETDESFRSRITDQIALDGGVSFGRAVKAGPGLK